MSLPSKESKTDVAMIDQFEMLFPQFRDSYLATEDGRRHIGRYETSRREGRRNYTEIVRAADAGEDVTDEVLLGLLPYDDTAANRDKGAWTPVAPAIRGDLRKWYEAKGWIDPGDWPKVAGAILNFVQRCHDHPEELEPACKEFDELPHTTGFQTGMLTPILSALRPEKFLLINKKSRHTINYFAGTSHGQKLREYPEINASGWGLIDELAPVMHRFDLPEMQDADLFDMFSHWLVAELEFDFGPKETKVEPMLPSSEPFEEPRPAGYFTRTTFELLEGLHRDPTKDYYMDHRDDFEIHLMEPFKHLFYDVAEDLPPTITDRMETERWLFSRIPKNDYGQGGAWDYYWGAFYPKGSKRLEDAQLSLWINYERLEIGFYIGEYGTEQRQRFLRRCRVNCGELQTILQDVLSGDDIVFAPHKGVLIKPDGSVEGTLDLTWQEWLENPDRADFDVSVVLPRTETLAASEDELRDRVARVYERLFPLVLLTIEDDPLPAIAEYLDSSGYLDSEEMEPELAPAVVDLDNVLQTALSARGLQYSDWQVATFYTALQTKGFVILSGISGTGKTRLAQAFAKILPQPIVPQAGARDDVISITVQPYMPKYNRLIIPKHFTKLYEPPPLGESKDVELTFDGHSQVCRVQYADYANTSYIALYLRGVASSWFGETFEVGDTVVLEPRSDENGRFLGFHMGRPSDRAFWGGERGQEPRNSLFVPVRSDWRDSKSLLGYYNPLTETYEWTDFLRFLLRAVQSCRQGDGLAWIVILDEMNLARVEYYFADLLSVLESGRDDEGWTQESIRLAYPKDAEGDLPPSQVKVPPNFYVVGTVNVDETTHTFSPKVLDRAFTLELTEADFSEYPPDPSEVLDGHVDARERRAMLVNFTRDGQFVRIDKSTIAAYVKDKGDVREHLQSLNDQLRPYQLHFGYRVFDEIVAFLISAQENDLYSSMGEAFDAAVLMKVLPKFHGSRGKLEEPLKHVLAWCMSPDAPDYETINETLRGQEDSDAAVRALEEQSYRYARTAGKARRMLWEIYASGFASFS